MVDYPKDWQKVQLGEVLRYTQPGEFIANKIYKKGRYPVLTAGKSFILGYSNEENWYNHIPTILFDDFTTEVRYVNYPFFVRSSATKFLNLNLEGFNLKFLYYMINNLNYQVEAHERHWIKRFSAFEVCVPSIEEQNIIVDTLGSFDKLLENLDNLIEKKRMIKAGAVEDLMTGKTRLDGYDDEWEEKCLAKICNIYDGTHQTPKYTNNGIRFVSVEDISNLKDSRKFISINDFRKDFKIYPENKDILMTRIGDIGTPCLLKDDEKIAYYVSLALLKNIKINSEYLYQYIRSSNFKNELDKRILHHATPIKINKNDIGKCQVNYPTDIKEQEAIASILTSMDEEIENLEKEKAKIEKIKDGAMDDLLTGRVRLI